MAGNVNGALLYLLAAAAIVYLFAVRRGKLAGFANEQVPELDGPCFEELKGLLKMAYERMLYLGASFLPLAAATYRESGAMTKIFFLILILFMFISNIGPRNKIMRLLEEHGLTVGDLKKRGIVL